MHLTLPQRLLNAQHAKASQLREHCPIKRTGQLVVILERAGREGELSTPAGTTARTSTSVNSPVKPLKSGTEPVRRFAARNTWPSFVRPVKSGTAVMRLPDSVLAIASRGVVSAREHNQAAPRPTAAYEHVQQNEVGA